jgi:hypothetical protein
MTCACGCGRPTPIVTKTDKRRGLVRGRPAKWAYGHQHRVHRPLQWNAHEPEWYAAQRRTDAG